MKVITTNLLNKFWKDGVLPIKNGKINVTDIVNNLTTTAANKVLDARQGKALADKYDQLNRNMPAVRRYDVSFAANSTTSTVAVAGIKANDPVIAQRINSAPAGLYPVAAAATAAGVVTVVLNTAATSATTISVSLAYIAS